MIIHTKNSKLKITKQSHKTTMLKKKKKPILIKKKKKIKK